MFLVEKTHLTSHFKSLTKKSSPNSKSYQLAAQSFDEKVISHLKTLTIPSDSSIISLTWMSKAVKFLETIHFESHHLISNLRSESDYFVNLYMDYSFKVVELCNLISSAVAELTERRLLMKLGLKLLESSSPEKLKKAKDALIRSVDHARGTSMEKGSRAKVLIEELNLAINSLPIGKTVTGKDLIRRTLFSLGLLTVFVSSVLVSVFYRSDMVEIRVPIELGWVDSVNGIQRQIVDLIKPKELWLLEIEDISNRCAGLDKVNGDKRRVLENEVTELGSMVAKFSGGVDELTNGVNGLFGSVLKTRNGILNGVRKTVW